MRNTFDEAIGWYNDYTCIRWQPRTNEANYVRVESFDQGCYSYVGRIGNDQELNLQTNGCNYVSLI